MGFKVILDWVANHTGWDNPWIANADWYHRDATGTIIAPNADWTDVAWLDYGNPAVSAAMIDAMRYWVTEYDIDGFRADHASGVPVAFWNQATRGAAGDQAAVHAGRGPVADRPARPRVRVQLQLVAARSAQPPRQFRRHRRGR